MTAAPVGWAAPELATTSVPLPAGKGTPVAVAVALTGSAGQSESDADSEEEVVVEPDAEPALLASPGRAAEELAAAAAWAVEALPPMVT